jgi:uncharacterized peroxidase-related enzyme
MQHLSALDPATTTGVTKDLFNGIQNKLGMVPNMMRTMGNSPAVLNGYLTFSGILSEGQLGVKTGELIALAVANINTCNYCNAAHSLIAEKLVHVDPAGIAAARTGNSSNAKVQAALKFALKVVSKEGEVSATDIAAVKAAGYDDGAIAEIIAHVALNIFTNYFNKAAKVELDFPTVPLAETAVV